MKLYNIGYNQVHDKYFKIYNEKGVDCWLFLLIKTPAVFYLNNEKILIKENSFVLFPKGAVQHYHAIEDEYIDDWFYFDINDEFISKYEIPVNKATWIGDITELTSIIHNMSYEFHTNNIYSSDINMLSLEIFFIKLSRQLKQHLKSPLFNNSKKYSELIKLRMDIYNNPSMINTVEKMAFNLSISVSNLQHSYKKTFGVNIMTDIVNSRLTKAKQLLSTSNLSVKEIAQLCGYSNEFNLMRQFKLKFSQTPSEYRQSH